MAYSLCDVSQENNVARQLTAKMDMAWFMFMNGKIVDKISLIQFF